MSVRCAAPSIPKRRQPMPLEGSHKPKKEIPEGVWTKCDKCEQIIYNKELEENFKICPKCGAHFRLNARERIKQLFDEGTFKEFGENILPTDSLSFVDIQQIGRASCRERV